MTPANAFAVERPRLRLIRAAALAAAIGDLDRKIDAPVAPSPVQSPVRIGVLERKPDYMDGGRAMYVFLAPGGPTNAITVGVPTRGIDRETERVICELVANVLSNLEPAPVDD